MRNIIVYVELKDKLPINVSLEALSEFKRLCQENNAKLISLVIGGDNNTNKICSEYGADEVICVKRESYQLEDEARVVENIVKSNKDCDLILGSTQRGKDIAAIVAKSLDKSSVNDCVKVEVDNDVLKLTTFLYGGSILNEVVDNSASSRIITIRQGSFKKHPFEGESNCNVKEVDVPKEGLLAKIVESVKELQESVNLEDAEIIVCGGRGMGSKENFELVHELAKALGGVVAATRPATEAEWLPRSYQIGQSGKIVSPKLYIGCGVSGATQHISGVMGADYIVAINKDADAPIFEIADLGIVASVNDALPILIEEVKKLKA